MSLSLGLTLGGFSVGSGGGASTAGQPIGLLLALTKAS
jgi:hypothetical protein